MSGYEVALLDAVLGAARDAAAEAETFAHACWLNSPLERELAERRRMAGGSPSCGPHRPWRALLTAPQITLILAAEEAGLYAPPFAALEPEAV